MIIECMISINEEVQFSSHGDENAIHLSNEIWTWCYISNGEQLFFYLALKLAAFD